MKTDLKTSALIRLVALLCAVLLVWAATPAPRWAASIETASFRLSLTIDAETVRLRTGAFDSGQERARTLFELRR